MQLAQVRHAALGQVDVRLQGHARGHRRVAHQVGVRRLLPADDDGGDPLGDHGVDAVLPARYPPRIRTTTTSTPASSSVELTSSRAGTGSPTDSRAPLARAVIRSVSDVDSSRTVGSRGSCTPHSYRTGADRSRRCGTSSAVVVAPAAVPRLRYGRPRTTSIATTSAANATESGHLLLPSRPPDRSNVPARGGSSRKLVPAVPYSGVSCGTEHVRSDVTRVTRQPERTSKSRGSGVLSNSR